MNKINIEEIEKEVIKLSGFIKNYENNYLNLFNELKNSSLLWNDEHSTIFYKRIDEELKNNNLLFNNIKDNYNIKSYIYDSYKSIGKIIYYDFDKVNEIIKCYDNIINKFNNYLNLINDMDYTFYDSEQIRMVNEIIYKFNKVINKLEDSKDEVIKTIDKIKDIENQVKGMLISNESININSFKVDNLYS